MVVSALLLMLTVVCCWHSGVRVSQCDARGAPADVSVSRLRPGGARRDGQRPHGPRRHRLRAAPHPRTRKSDNDDKLATVQLVNSVACSLCLWVGAWVGFAPVEPNFRLSPVNAPVTLATTDNTLAALVSRFQTPKTLLRCCPYQETRTRFNVCSSGLFQ